MAAPEHIPPKELREAVATDKLLTQTSNRLHEDLASHNNADLLKTVSHIDVSNLGGVLGCYQGQFHKDLITEIKADQTLSAEVQKTVLEQLNRKETAEDFHQEPAKMFGAMRRAHVLGWLAQNSFMLQTDQLAAETGAYDKLLGSEQDFHFPLIGQSSPKGQQLIQEGERMIATAESHVRDTLAGYSLDEYRAIDEISRNHGQSLMKSLANNDKFSQATRSFISDLNQKSGL